MSDKKQPFVFGAAPQKPNPFDRPMLDLAKAAEVSVSEPKSKLKLGITLAESHHYEEAKRVLEGLLEALPASRDLHTWLGSLYRAVGEDEKSVETIRGFFGRHPNQFLKSKRKDAPSILCAFGVENTEYRLGRSRDGRASKKRRGGHFNLEYLLNEASYSFNNYSIVENNINRLDLKGHYDLLLNTIADPDVEMASLKALAQFVDAHPELPVINHPAQVIPTSRDGNYQTFKHVEGIHFPHTERLYAIGREANEIADDIERRGFAYPFIMRQPGTHTARSTELVVGRDELVSYITDAQSDCYYVIEFVPNASAEGHYSKIRFFAIDGILYPVVYHVDQVWNVHGGNRKTFMADHDWMQAREAEFLNDPASVIGTEVHERLKKIPALIGLDFFGFDCTVQDDGTVLIFELNPAMRHSFDHAANFEYMRSHMQAITDAFTQMVETRIQGAPVKSASGA